jgi:sec-independent protein translocase protein TatA
MLPNVGMGELILILVIALILFGPKRLPEVAKGLGRSIKAFKEGMSEPSEPASSQESNPELLESNKK